MPSALATMPPETPAELHLRMLWPARLLIGLGEDLLERLYGDVPAKARLRLDEVAATLLCDAAHVRRLIRAGELDAVNVASADSRESSYRVYRYSVILFLFRREFVGAEAPRCNLPREDLDRIDAVVEALNRKGVTR